MVAASVAQLPLAMARESEDVRVVRVTQGGASGSIVRVKGAQLGLDRTTCMHVFVS